MEVLCVRKVLSAAYSHVSGEQGEDGRAYRGKERIMLESFILIMLAVGALALWR
jgi:hypothetical protein